MSRAPIEENDEGWADRVFVDRTRSLIEFLESLAPVVVVLPDPRLGTDWVELQHFLRDLDGVEGGALAEVVADAPEEQGVGSM
jgi:hypothetical protein